MRLGAIAELRRTAQQALEEVEEAAPPEATKADQPWYQKLEPAETESEEALEELARVRQAERAPAAWLQASQVVAAEREEARQPAAWSPSSPSAWFRG